MQSKLSKRTAQYACFGRKLAPAVRVQYLLRYASITMIFGYAYKGSIDRKAVLVRVNIRRRKFQFAYSRE